MRVVSEKATVTDLLLFLYGDAVEGKITDKVIPTVRAYLLKSLCWSNTKNDGKQVDLSIVANNFEIGDFISILGQVKPREYSGNIYWDVSAKSLELLSHRKTRIDPKFSIPKEASERYSGRYSVLVLKMRMNIERIVKLSNGQTLTLKQNILEIIMSDKILYGTNILTGKPIQIKDWLTNERK